mgnify:CR=1 FL=1
MLVSVLFYDYLLFKGWMNQKERRKITERTEAITKKENKKKKEKSPQKKVTFSSLPIKIGCTRSNHEIMEV